jgi:DNA-binding winged helix-turn-helix (wHTH) protein
MGQQSGYSYEFDGYSLNALKRVPLHGGDPVPFTPKAFDTLLVLVRNGGRVVSKDELTEGSLA